MKFDVKEERDNPVMKRKEIKAKIDFGGGATPSKAEMQVAIATERNVAPDHVEITKIVSDHGMPGGMVWARIWEEKKVEIYAKPKEEKPAEAPKEEAPKEEPKAEEATKEEKPEEPKAEEAKPEPPKE